jgi:hypothetical protein
MAKGDDMRRLIARALWAVWHKLGIRDSWQVMGIRDPKQFARDMSAAFERGVREGKGEEVSHGAQ